MTDKVYLDPPYAEWTSLLQRNIGQRETRAERQLLPCGVCRNEVIDAAVAFTTQVQALGAECGLSLDFAMGPRESIVMAGHQPLVFHRGLRMKTIFLERIARATASFGIHVSIDTDAGDAVELHFPKRAGLSFRIVSHPLATGHGLYGAQRLKDAVELGEIFDEAVSALFEGGFANEAAQMRTVGELYAKLAGAPLVESQVAVRWALNGPRHFSEIPLSRLVATPSMQKALRGFLGRSKALFDSYNVVLDRHRSEHKIKNPANPFPNLKRHGDLLELPLWNVSPDMKTREPIWALPDTQPPGDFLLVPRGALISTVMRLLASDLFIHGRGGAKYDTFTDAWIREFFGIEPPAFVVASATSYLFEAEVQKEETNQALREALRDAPAHPDRYLDDERFLPEVREKLGEILDEKRALIAAVQTGDVAAKKRLSDLGREVRAFLDAKMPSPPELAPQIRALYEFRQFPDFLFPPLGQEFE